jgi:hypothetical protein
VLASGSANRQEARFNCFLAAAMLRTPPLEMRAFAASMMSVLDWASGRSWLQMGTFGAWAEAWPQPAAAIATIQASFILKAACIGPL